MNRRDAITLAIGLLAAPLDAVADAGLQPFAPGSLQRILAHRQGQPFLLVLWSITCAPCREEFALLAAVLREHPRLPLVLVCTDEVADEDAVRQVLAHYGLQGEESWIFAGDNPQAMRWEIDPTWYGEMPRAYFYDAAHRREAVSGSLGRERVEAWLAATQKAPGA